jgi:hypothetical protein
MSDTPRDLKVITPPAWDTAADSEVHESLAELPDTAIAAMLGKIIPYVVKRDSDWITLVASIVADIRAAERIRLRRGH